MKKISLSYRIKVVVVFVLAFAVGYGFTNHFPIFTPRYLPMTFIDDFFGFRPWTSWIYMSDFLLMFLPIILVTEIAMMKRLMRAFFLSMSIHYLFFFFFPTTMHRPPLTGDGVTEFVFGLVRMIDTPVNCFPSMHVSLCFVVALSFWHTKKVWSVFFLIWASLIALSTLSTKQHYLWDVLGGLIIAAIACAFAFRRRTRDKLTLISPTQ